MLILYFKHSGESNDCYGLPSCAAKLCCQKVVLCCAVLCCAVLCCGQATRMPYTSDAE